MESLLPEETETIFTVCADDRSECEIFTEDIVWIERLEKWFKPYKRTDTGRWFRVPTLAVLKENQLSRGNKYLEKISGENER